MPIAVDPVRRRTRLHLGRCLRLARAFADLSQAEAARRLGVRRSTLVTWEAGEREPMAVDLLRLAEIYGVSLDALAGRAALPLVT